MAETIIDGIGSGYLAGVTSDNRLLVSTEGITVGSLSISAGSTAYNYGSSGTGWLPVLVDEDGKLMTDTSVTIGSIQTYNPIGVGSVLVTNVVGVSGNVCTGSESWIQNFGDLGSQRTISAGSVIITNTVDVLGSINVNNAAGIGSLATQSVTPSGTFGVDVNNFGDLGTTRQITAGSVIVTNIVAVSGVFFTGSETWVKEIPKTEVYGSGVFSISGALNVSTGSVVYQGTSPWVSVGSVNINNASSIGSIGIQKINGSIVDLETNPDDSSKNNPAYSFDYSGTVIGSINQFIGGSQFVQVLAYSGISDSIVSVGSWTVV